MVLLRNDALHPDYSTQYLTGQKEKNRKRKEKKNQRVSKAIFFYLFLTSSLLSRLCRVNMGNWMRTNIYFLSLVNGSLTN